MAIKKLAFLIVISIVFCPYLLLATTWHADSVNGSDANSCATAQSPGASAKATILAAVQCVGTAGTTDGAGDTVSVAPGNYDEGLYEALPSGTAGNPFTLTCSDPRNCHWEPEAAGSCNSECHIWARADTGLSYFTLSNFHIYSGDGDDCGIITDLLAGGHANQVEFDTVIFEGNEFGECQDGFVFAFEGVNNIVRQNYFHDLGEMCALGAGLCHAIYNGGSDYLIEDNDFENLWGYGVHIYTTSASETHDIIVRNNRFRHSLGGSAGSAILTDGDDTQIYGNVIWDTNGCVNLFDGAQGSLVYHNTCVDSTAYGVQIVNNGENDNNDIRNNIIFNSTGNEINDLCGVGCSGTVTSPNLTTDPDFVDPGSDNYHLLATSDARDAGDDLNAVVVTDHDGVALDDTPDEGAFQFVTGGALTSAPIHIHPRVIR